MIQLFKFKVMEVVYGIIQIFVSGFFNVKLNKPTMYSDF